jgi:hypothetical protein
VMDKLLLYETPEGDDANQPTPQLDFSNAGAPTFTRPTPTAPASGPSNFDTSSTGSAFDQFGSGNGNGNGNTGFNNGNGSDAASKTGVLALAGVLSLFLMLHNC